MKAKPPPTAILVLTLAAGCARVPAQDDAPVGSAGEDLEQRLTALQYQVTQCSATEPAFENEYWDNHEPGLYLDVVSGVPLFSSEDKFDSGSGWPAFTRPLAPEAVVGKEDRTLGMVRTEVRAAGSGSHLGHVFGDGPGPSGLRYCINSAALRFVPLGDLEREGLGAYLDLFPEELRGEAAASPGARREVAVLAGGCFWGMEDILRKVAGVKDTEVGYMGEPDPAEVVRIEFDPAELGFGELLDLYFRMHDPTTKNRQGNDRGSEYRSAIFFTTPEQREQAVEARKRAAASGRWQAPIVTEITAASTFRPAEERHQDYLVKHPGGYTCHYLRD